MLNLLYFTFRRMNPLLIKKKITNTLIILFANFYSTYNQTSETSIICQSFYYIAASVSSEAIKTVSFCSSNNIFTSFMTSAKMLLKAFTTLPSGNNRTVCSPLLSYLKNKGVQSSGLIAFVISSTIFPFKFSLETDKILFIAI